MVMAWVFGGSGCHATSKGSELSYKLGYFIKSALFCPFRPVCTVCPDIIRILWISTFPGYYLHFVDIICILWISLIYKKIVDIICIGHITS